MYATENSASSATGKKLKGLKKDNTNTVSHGGTGYLKVDKKMISEEKKPKQETRVPLSLKEYMLHKFNDLELFISRKLYTI